MATLDNLIVNRWHRRFLWIGAAILAVTLSLTAIHYLYRVPVLGVPAVDGNGELQKEEKPVVPPQ